MTTTEHMRGEERREKEGTAGALISPSLARLWRIGVELATRRGHVLVRTRRALQRCSRRVPAVIVVQRHDVRVALLHTETCSGCSTRTKRRRAHTDSVARSSSSRGTTPALEANTKDRTEDTHDGDRSDDAADNGTSV